MVLAMDVCRIQLHKGEEDYEKDEETMASNTFLFVAVFRL